MNSNKTQQIDLILESVKGDNNTIKKVLKIPYTDFNNDAALRIYNDKNALVFYASTRLMQIIKTNGGYEIDVTSTGKEFLNKRYEITEVVTKRIVCKGIITDKKNSEVKNTNKKDDA